VSDQALTPRARRRIETTTEILDAAWRLARRDGLASISMRELGSEVGLRAQSLYAYFASKAELYDAMFRQGQDQLAVVAAGWPTDLSESEEPRRAAKRIVHEFVAFCTDDPVRYQLLFQRVLPDWEPTPETYQLAVQRLTEVRRTLASLGIDSDEAADLFTALVTGLTDQQISNDPGGDRWIRLVDRAVDMFFDHVGTSDPGPTLIEEAR
jgi:AcrR family transcriptional regulator